MRVCFWRIVLKKSQAASAAKPAEMNLLQSAPAGPTTGVPTLIGKAIIPARNLSVDVLIRKNSDPSLPASHLMEINFRVSDTFIGAGAQRSIISSTLTMREAAVSNVKAQRDCVIHG